MGRTRLEVDRDLDHLRTNMEHLREVLLNLQAQEERLEKESEGCPPDVLTNCDGEPVLVEDYIHGTWECPTSPTGFCVYDRRSSLGDDDCLYCHGPDERK